MRKIIYIYIALLPGLFSCSLDNRNSKTEITIDDCLSDTSATYWFVNYYPQGGIRQRGYIKNGKKQRDWQEWYADGELKYDVEYEEGVPVSFNGNRKLPQIIFQKDSLKVGVSSYLKAIDLLPDETLGCNNGTIIRLKDDPLYDFKLTPAREGNVGILYFCTWITSSIKADTILLNVSEMKNPSEYGLTEDDLKDQSTIRIISKRIEPITLHTFPVYK